jgi:hypothetical protein
MLTRLLAIAVLGAALVACTPTNGSSPAIDPSPVLPTDVAPTDMMSAEPSTSVAPSP